MGKYTAALKGRPDRLGDDPSFQDVVNARKDELTADGMRGDATRLAAAFVAARKAKEVHDEAAGPINVEIAAVEQLVWEAFETAEVTAVTAGGYTVSVEQQPYSKVIDPSALRAWAIANGHEGNLSLPWQTVNALAKLSLLGEGSAPEGVEIQVQTVTKLRKK